VKGLILTNVAGCVRDAGRLYKSGYKKERCQPKIWGYSVLNASEEQYFIRNTDC